MAGGKGAKRKAKERQEAAAEELAGAVVEQGAEAVLNETPAEALFFVDTAGASAKRRRRIQQSVEKEKGTASKHEQKLINRLAKAKTTQQSAAKAPNARNREQRLLKGIIGCKAGEATQADDAMLYDAWGADANGGSAAGGARGVGSKRDVRGQGTGEGAVVRARNGTDRSAKLTSYALGAPMALPGQSYNPEQGDHEEAVAEAVALELKREDAVKAANAPIAQGLSAETLALLVGDDEGSSSDEDSGDDGDDGDITLAKKQTGKMTRAERNKQKRRKAAELDVKRRKAAKSSTHEQHRIKAIGAELEQQAKDRAEARKAKQMLKANKDGVPLKDADVMQAPSIPVNLAEELSGSLRQMRTRGSLLVDRVAMLKRVGVHPDKQKAAARAKMEKKPKKRFKFQERYKDFD